MGDTNRWRAGCLACAAAALLWVCFQASAGVAGSDRYVGSEACADCHDTQFENYKKFSKKAHSGNSVKIMAGDLTPSELKECYACHVTGYGQPGGFVSFTETPAMGDAGCEVCHGPGYDHIEADGDPELIKGDLEISDCESCHNADRVSAFDYKPLLYGGAH